MFNVVLPYIKSVTDEFTCTMYVCIHVICSMHSFIHLHVGSFSEWIRVDFTWYWIESSPEGDSNIFIYAPHCTCTCLADVH